MQSLRAQVLRFRQQFSAKRLPTKQFSKQTTKQYLNMASKIVQFEDIPTVNRAVGKKLVVACDGMFILNQFRDRAEQQYQGRSRAESLL